MKMGYIEVETQQGCNLFPPHCKARGHVYHFSEILQEKVVGGFHGPATDLEWQTGYQATMQVGLLCCYTPCMHGQGGRGVIWGWGGGVGRQERRTGAGQCSEGVHKRFCCDSTHANRPRLL